MAIKHYIADYGNHRVQKWPTGATSGITVAGVTSTPGSNLTLLYNPVAVLVDNNGYVIYFAYLYLRYTLFIFKLYTKNDNESFGTENIE